MIDLEAVLQKHRPTESQNSELKAIAQSIIDKTEAVINRLNVNANVLLVGSVAKGTNLASGDLDIFVVFSKDYSPREMEQLGLKIGHEVIPDGQEKYAEHPYVSGYLGERKIDIVPCFVLSPNTRIISSVDRTPLHTEYVLKNLSDPGKDEVRLLKLFMKTVGVYGSEIKVSGFSGYVCELLVIKYGSMMKVIETFSKTRGPLKFSLGDGNGDPEKYDSPVVIIDPTDITRNAAAAISEENFSRMKINCRMFLKSPDPAYFNDDRSYGPELFSERGTAVRVFLLDRPDLIDDILFSQAVRFRNILVQILEEEGFSPMSSEVDISDRIEVLVECKTDRIPGTRVHVGPPVDATNAMDFISKYIGGKSLRGPYVCGNRLCTDIVVENRDLEKVVRENLKKFSIGKNIDHLKEKMEIVDPVEEKKKFLVIGKFYRKVLREA